MTDPHVDDVAAPDGTRLRLWRRGSADAAEAILFVHGATYGGRAAFDPAGCSWLAAASGDDRAAYAVDLRGYGDSKRPPELDAPAEANDPVVRAATAATDVAAAVEALHEEHDAVHLVGYSWGTIVAGTALVERDLGVDSLVQYAPAFRPPESHRERFDEAGRTTAYRRVTREAARERWADQRSGGDVPEDAFGAFWDELVGSGQRVDDGAVLAPNGTLVDIEAAIDDDPYEPSAIDVPTLVVRGSLDSASTREDAIGLYGRLGAADATYVEIAGGTHFLQLEPNRDVLYDAVASFHDRVGRG